MSQGMASKKKVTFSIDDAAKLMKTTRKKAIGRLAALGYTVTCSRCGGGGLYSWNPKDGSRCFGCDGRGKMLAPITVQIATEALARIEAGELAGYFARGAARAAIKSKGAAFRAAYMSSHVGATYTALSESRSMPSSDVIVSPEFRAMGLLNAAFGRVCDLESPLRAPADPIETCAQIDQAIAFLAEVDQAWAAFSEARDRVSSACPGRRSPRPQDRNLGYL